MTTITCDICGKKIERKDYGNMMRIQFLKDFVPINVPFDVCIECKSLFEGFALTTHEFGTFDDEKKKFENKKRVEEEMEKLRNR